MKRNILIALFILVPLSSALSQIHNPVKWTYGAKRISNTEAVVFAKANIQHDWYIYMD